MYKKRLKNYQRYKETNRDQFNRKTLLSLLTRSQSDHIILPLISEISNKRVLEIGPGTGYYTKYLLQNNNKVIGVDPNPHLGKGLPIQIISCTATTMEQYLGKEKFDAVISFFMTDYLNPSDIKKFLENCCRLTSNNGKIITTFIAAHSLGKLYTRAAHLKGIKKFAYSKSDIELFLSLAHQPNYELIEIRSSLRLLFAYLLIIKHTPNANF